MKKQAIEKGSMMLLVVVLMSILLVLCTRMWRTTAYVVDISLYKQVHMQKKWALEGIMRCGIEACKIDFKALAQHIHDQGVLTLPITSYSFDVPHLADTTYFLIFERIDDKSIKVTAQAQEKRKIVMHASGIVLNTTIVA